MNKVAGPKVPGSKDELVSLAKQVAKEDTFGFAIGSGPNIGRYAWGFHNLLWQNGTNIFTPDGNVREPPNRPGIEPAAVVTPRLCQAPTRVPQPEQKCALGGSSVPHSVQCWTAGASA